MDQRTKRTNDDGALHPRDNIDRLCVRKEGEREQASIEDSGNPSIRRLEDNIKKSKGRLITATRNGTENIMIKKTKKNT